MLMLMRKNTSLVFSFIPVLLGIYIIVNNDFLTFYGNWNDYGMGWIDDGKLNGSNNSEE